MSRELTCACFNVLSNGFATQNNIIEEKNQINSIYFFL